MKHWTAQIYNEQDCESGILSIDADTQDEAQHIVDEYSDLYRGYYAILNTAQDEQSSEQLVKRIIGSFAGRA